jgi:hypothetical protein
MLPLAKMASCSVLACSSSMALMARCGFSGALILNVAQDRIGWPRGKTGEAADHASQLGAFEAGLQV